MTQRWTEALTTFDQRSPATTDNRASEVGEDVAVYVERLRANLAQQAALREDEKTLKGALRSRLPGGDYTHDGQNLLHMGDPGRQFSVRRFAAAPIPDTLRTLCLSMQPDAELARRILPPELYDQCCTPREAAVKPV